MNSSKIYRKLNANPLSRKTDYSGVRVSAEMRTSGTKYVIVKLKLHLLSVLLSFSLAKIHFSMVIDRVSHWFALCNTSLMWVANFLQSLQCGDVLIWTHGS